MLIPPQLVFTVAVAVIATATLPPYIAAVVLLMMYADQRRDPGW